MKFITFFICFTLLIACKSDDLDPKSSDGQIRIRIWNDTSHKMDDVFVKAGNPNEYGTIESKKKSKYMQYVSAYRYAFVSFKIDGKAFLIQPIDYVGETPLEPGLYTYRLSVDNLNNPYAILEFIED